MIPRSSEVVSNEIVLERALVAVVVGTRPASSTADVEANLSGHFGVDLGSFVVHPHHPKDFLILFRDSNTMVRVLHATVLEGSFRLTFHRWRHEN